MHHTTTYGPSREDDRHQATLDTEDEPGSLAPLEKSGPCPPHITCTLYEIPPYLQYTPHSRVTWNLADSNPSEVCPLFPGPQPLAGRKKCRKYRVAAGGSANANANVRESLRATARDLPVRSRATLCINEIHVPSRRRRASREVARPSEEGAPAT